MKTFQNSVYDSNHKIDTGEKGVGEEKYLVCLGNV